MSDPSENQRQDEVRDANTCLALGAGVGAMGTGAALLTGIACPICIVLAPALLGVGAWKRLAASRKGSDGNDPGKPEDPSSSQP